MTLEITEILIILFALGGIFFLGLVADLAGRHTAIAAGYVTAACRPDGRTGDHA